MKMEEDPVWLAARGQVTRCSSAPQKTQTSLSPSSKLKSFARSLKGVV